MTRIYLAAGATYLRKGFDGLHALVRERLELDPLSGHVFVFANRARTRLRIVEKGLVSDRLVADTVVAKHVEHPPLCRQSGKPARRAPSGPGASSTRAPRWRRVTCYRLGW